MRQWAASSLREWTSNRTRWNSRSWAVGRSLASCRRHDWVNSCRKKSRVVTQTDLSPGIEFFRDFHGENRVWLVLITFFRTVRWYVSMVTLATCVTHSHQRVFQGLTCMSNGLLGHCSITVGLDLQHSHLPMEIICQI